MEHSAAKLASALRQTKVPKVPWIEQGAAARFPDAYKKYWYEYWREPTPVHYRKDDRTWYRDEETGQVRRVRCRPISGYNPPEAHKGIWAGEQIIKGFQKRQELKKRVPHYWVPALYESVVYSEILNKHMSTTVTKRAKVLIVENFGLDHFLLKTPACDLRSNVALGLKRLMLLALRDKTLYPDDPEKQAEVYDKYKHYLDAYTHDEIEWYGLRIADAFKKLEKIEAEASVPKPLKILYRYELLNDLRNPPPPEEASESSSKPKEWIKKLNPFASRS